MSLVPVITGLALDEINGIGGCRISEETSAVSN